MRKEAGHDTRKIRLTVNTHFKQAVKCEKKRRASDVRGVKLLSVGQRSGVVNRDLVTSLQVKQAGEKKEERGVGERQQHPCEHLSSVHHEALRSQFAREGREGQHHISNKADNGGNKPHAQSKCDNKLTLGQGGRRNLMTLTGDRTLGKVLPSPAEVV